jgi:hypothetical protein
LVKKQFKDRLTVNYSRNIIFAGMRSIQIFLFLIFLLLLSSKGLLAQSNNATLFGKVTDNSGNPVEFANISLKNSTIGTVSDRKGEYLLRIPAKKPVVIVFSMIGYQKVEKSMTANEEQRIQLNMAIQSVDQEIGEVQIPPPTK